MNKSSENLVSKENQVKQKLITDNNEKIVIAIIGGGFAGQKIYQKFKNNKNIEILFYDNKSFFEFTPSTLRTLIYPDRAPYILPLHPPKKIHIDLVKKLSVNQQKINIYTENSKNQCDFCIISTGSSYIQPIKSNCEKIIDREKRIQQFFEYNLKIKNSETILVVGGGSVGVELIAELAAKFKNQKRLILVNRGISLLDRLHPRCGKIALNWLQKKGVEIYLGESIIDWGDPNSQPIIVKTASGLVFKCNLLFKCIGFQPNSEIAKNILNNYNNNNNEINFSENFKHLNPIPVNQYLQVESSSGNFEKIFCCGDVEGVMEEKTAFSAEMGAKLVAKNIQQIIDGQQDNLYQYPEGILPKKLNQLPVIACISLGPYNGIMQVCCIVLSGMVAAFVKKVIEYLQIAVINERWWAIWLWETLEKIMLLIACHLKQYPKNENIVKKN